jgi:hypothetical protein
MGGASSFLRKQEKPNEDARRKFSDIQGKGISILLTIFSSKDILLGRRVT